MLVCFCVSEWGMKASCVLSCMYEMGVVEWTVCAHVRLGRHRCRRNMNTDRCDPNIWPVVGKRRKFEMTLCLLYDLRIGERIDVQFSREDQKEQEMP